MKTEVSWFSYSTFELASTPDLGTFVIQRLRDDVAEFEGGPVIEGEAGEEGQLYPRRLMERLEALEHLVGVLVTMVDKQLSEEEVDALVELPYEGPYGRDTYFSSQEYQDVTTSRHDEGAPDTLDPQRLKVMADFLTQHPEGLNAIRVALDMREEEIAR